ncbi:DUF2807 domain-containing protein [Hallella multisaccharivorax DSM 17128]|uniref:Putative auto-transporter adhesin head GIN domain-containing protein n=1 Tax=Hallella multisaccharivorax DSM 17128 TaxID=688246 RepID=F8N857_9BACT|nr:DUF2807 domain-containing protein [Hallella multisaccharivorax]EGN56495.1 hypothetical protein Premu_1055 [Hallella multisaccharivorax DSM 17128]GJG30026.1 DUF2807 domain-containing protein [Hallella multisaccharivorax DSM 17128]
MKRTISLLFVLIAILSFSACRIEKVNDSKEPAKTWQLNLRNFSAIRNSTGCDIHFIQSDTFKVTLKATQLWRDTHNISVEDGNVLSIYELSQRERKGITVLRINNEYGAELWVSAPSLTNVETYGSGDFTTDKDINGESLNISIAGSGDTSLKGVSLSKNFTYQLSGSGDLITGTIRANKVDYGIAGSGDVSSKLNNVNDTQLTIAGSGDADLTFSGCRHAAVSISGSGDIKLSGQLETLDKQVSGSGDIYTSKLRLGK